MITIVARVKANLQIALNYVGFCSGRHWNNIVSFFSRVINKRSIQSKCIFIEFIMREKKLNTILFYFWWFNLKCTYNFWTKYGHEIFPLAFSGQCTSRDRIISPGVQHWYDLKCMTFYNGGWDIICYRLRDKIRLGWCCIHGLQAGGSNLYKINFRIWVLHNIRSDAYINLNIILIHWILME